MKHFDNLLEDPSSNDGSYFRQREADLRVENFELMPPPPLNSLVEVTGSCNHACVFCHSPFMERQPRVLDFKIFEKFVVQFLEMGGKEMGLYGPGEPLLVKNLDEYISFAKRNGVKRVYMTTNGSLGTLDRIKKLVESGLDSIKFSINAATRNSYILVHGVDDFDKVLDLVMQVRRWRDTDRIPLQILGSCVIISATEGDVQLHRDTFGEYLDDIDYVVGVPQAGRAKAAVREIFLTGRPEGAGTEAPAVRLNPCEMIWNRWHLNCDGKLSACCVDYENDLTVGILGEATLREIWHGRAYTHLRQLHLTGRIDGTICKPCLSGSEEDYSPLKFFPKSEIDRSPRAASDTLLRIDKLKDTNAR